ncbi:MAG: phosphotransferase [Rhodobacteraceae bacterium]|nr:phosphotransferase [Paracoccaceae bacterium]
MAQNAIFTFAAEILAHIGESPDTVSFLTKGATCDVWLVQTSNQQSYALRIIEEDDRVIASASDKFIRESVQDRGGRVGAVLLSSESPNMPLLGKRWSLDAFISGSHPERGSLSEVVCQQLGETLAALHQLPVQNFGRPSGVDQGVLIGEQTTAIKGVKQRFENPLPVTWDKDYTHPVLVAVPNLSDAILARLAVVGDAVDTQQAVSAILICTKSNCFAARMVWPP